MRLAWTSGFLFLFVFAAAAVGADISGQWTAEPHMGGGGSEQPVETTFTFEVDGETVTGTISSERGEFPIQDGKLAGDTLTFTVEPPGARILYDGLIQEDGINFLAEFEGRGRTDQFIAKRKR